MRKILFSLFFLTNLSYATDIKQFHCRVDNRYPEYETNDEIPKTDYEITIIAKSTSSSNKNYVVNYKFVEYNQFNGQPPLTPIISIVESNSCDFLHFVKSTIFHCRSLFAEKHNYANLLIEEDLDGNILNSRLNNEIDITCNHI